MNLLTTLSSKETSSRDRISSLQRQIFTLCWGKFDTPEIYKLLAQLYLNLSNTHFSPFSDGSIWGTPKALINTSNTFRKAKRKRHQFSDYLMTIPSVTGRELAILPSPILDIGDLEHIFAKIDTETNEELRKKWVLCLSYLQYGVSLPEMSERWNKIHKQYPDILTSNAEETIQKREESSLKDIIAELPNYKQEKKEKQRRVLMRKQNIKIIKKILHDRSASKSFSSIIHFFIDETDIDTIDYRSHDIWKEFSEEEISKLTIAAKNFLFETKVYSSSSGELYSAYPRAFYILYTEDPSSEFKNIPEFIWKKFAFKLFNCADFDNKNILNPIFKHMAEAYPKVFIDAIALKGKKQIGIRLCF